MEYKDYYKILGVDKKVSQAELKKKFRKLAIQYHPDKNPDNSKAEQRFKEISEAYEVLGDKEKRKKYDELGANWKQYEQYKRAGGSGSKGGGHRYSGSHSEFFGGGGFSDFFNSFFGGGASFGASDSGFRRSQSRQANSTARLNLSFDEAFSGVGKVIQVNGEKIRLQIKPGSYNEQKIKLKGKGQGGGDLIITLSVTASPKYRIEGHNIHTKLVADLLTAVLGGNLKVDTPHGTLSLPISAGTQPGKKLRLKGKGYPVYGEAGKFGDLIVEIQVSIPQELNTRERELFEELRRA